MNERKDEHFFNISEISTNIKKLKISKGPKKFNKILETHLWRNETARRFGPPNSNFDRKQHLGRNLLEDFTYFQGEAIFKNNFRWLLLRNEIIYMTVANRQFLLQTLFDFRLYFYEKSFSLTHLSLVSKNIKLWKGTTDSFSNKSEWLTNKFEWLTNDFDVPCQYSAGKSYWHRNTINCRKL